MWKKVSLTLTRFSNKGLREAFRAQNSCFAFIFKRFEYLNAVEQPKVILPILPILFFSSAGKKHFDNLFKEKSRIKYSPQKK